MYKTVPGMDHLKVLDKDHIEAIVDGDPEVFSRGDRYSGHPMSGLASYGNCVGDWRMIQAIADDIMAAFEEIK